MDSHFNWFSSYPDNVVKLNTLIFSLAGCNKAQIRKGLTMKTDLNIISGNIEQMISKSIDFHCHGVGHFDFNRHIIAEFSGD